jgi:hypothetical protein
VASWRYGAKQSDMFPLRKGDDPSPALDEEFVWD